MTPVQLIDLIADVPVGAELVSIRTDKDGVDQESGRQVYAAQMFFKLKGLSVRLDFEYLGRVVNDTEYEDEDAPLTHRMKLPYP